MTTTANATEPLAVGVQRAALAHLDDALTTLADEPDGREKAVHEARKSLKQARAMLRLVRPGLSKDAYAEGQDSLRGLGHRLAPARDAWVRVETLDDLAAGDLVSPGTFAGLREVLVGRHREASAAVLDDPSTVTAVREGLATARERVAGWDADSWDDGDAVVLEGLGRVYAQGRKRYRRALKKPSARRLHDWRKRVKDLGYELRFLSPLWAPVLDSVAAECQVTWDRLGDDHDLVVLRDDVDDLVDTLERPADLAVLDDLIDTRRAALQHGALSLGARLYADDPDAFVARAAAYVEVWHRDAEPSA